MTKKYIYIKSLTFGKLKIHTIPRRTDNVNTLSNSVTKAVMKKYSLSYSWTKKKNIKKNSTFKLCDEGDHKKMPLKRYDEESNKKNALSNSVTEEIRKKIHFQNL